MFKKALRSKPSAPIKNSECRKFRAEVGKAYGVDNPELAHILVPEGLQFAKFYTSAGEAGGMYVDPKTSEPLWFTLGKEPDPIPTVYTLWKIPLLTCLSTPQPALERIEDGADLMIPGVKSISHFTTPMPALGVRSVVAVTRLGSTVPVAVGRLLVPLKDIISSLESDDDTKGKAVDILHVYKDHLWGLGSNNEPPTYLPDIQTSNKRETPPMPQEGAETSIPSTLLRRPQSERNDSPDALISATDSLVIEDTNELEMTPAEVDAALNLALLSCISRTLPQLPDALPCPAGTFLTAFVQPSRPYGTPNLDLRKSSFKTFTKFLKLAEKDGLLKMKEIKDVAMVMSVNTAHHSIASLPKFGTVGEAEEKERLKVERRKQQEGRIAPMVAQELWKPHGTTVAFFEACEKLSSELYPAAEVRTVLTEYITSRNLVHPREKLFVICDDLLKNVLRQHDKPPLEFVRRDELQAKILELMQPWHIVGDEKPKKGVLKPVNVSLKLRGGRKTLTTITGFESFGVSAEFLAEEFRKICASATTFGLIPGQPKTGKAMEVLIQGKHLAAVRDFLIAQGVPKKLIVESDLVSKKK